ncbi:right-handed parallel beta-helix repeat-containing protein [Jiangella anatolica]|uniref:Right handed beta helix domain-containing protein n=1 Tax=Jiangella anatolica TaxID=2670374 RepID=A0A2W2BYN1_9ACTN|nr:right-handed parallel beta-helix repeat-containing protein [Jiangella anatolica]PZF85604.1 hypothetical protein C1I92_04355 [Jiangella anatolica]
MKITRGLLAAAVLVAGAVLAAPPATAAGTTYYVDRTNPACSDSGPGNATTPWCTFTPVNSHGAFGPGDSILLARGVIWDQWLDLEGSGTAAEPITLGAFGAGAKPKITNNDTANSGYGIRVTDGSHWVIKDLEIDGAGANKLDAGVQVVYPAERRFGLTLSNLYVHHNRLGIAVTGAASAGIDDVVITGVEGTHNETSIALGSGTTPASFIRGALISKVNLHHDDGAPAPERDCRDSLALQSATDLIVTNSLISYAGGCHAPAGTTGVYVGHVADSTLLNNIIVNTAQTASPDQSGIVFQAGASNVAVRGNYLGGHPRWSVEVLNIHQSPAGDHAGVVVDANAMALNGTGDSIYKYGTLSTSTGTIDRNLWQGTSLTRADGTTFAGFVIGGQGANPGPVTSDRVWYAARDYTNAQGYQGWRYEYSTDASVTWSPLTYISAAQGWRRAADGLPMINQWNLAPAGGTSARVARSWTAPATGTVAITGQVAMSSSVGDGVRVHVLRTTGNGANTVVLGPITVGAGDLAGKPTAVSSLQVAAGDVIRFVVDSGTSGANGGDTVNWSPAIGYL